MSFRSLKHKDQYRRVQFKKKEFLRILLKALSVHITLPDYIREYMYYLTQSFSHAESKTFFRNRCVFSNKARYIFTKYKVSRLALKRLVVRGKVMGLYKSRW